MTVSARCTPMPRATRISSSASAGQIHISRPRTAATITPDTPIRTATPPPPHVTAYAALSAPASQCSLHESAAITKKNENPTVAIAASTARTDRIEVSVMSTTEWRRGCITQLSRNLRYLGGDAVHQRGVALDLGVPAGLAAAHHTGGQLTVGIGPDRAVDQPEMAERRGRTQAEWTETLCAELEAGAPAGRHESGCHVRSQSATLPRCVAQCLGTHHPDAVEFASATPYFGEPGHLGGVRDGVRRRDHGLEKERGVGDRDDFVGGTADRLAEGRRDRSGQQRFAGGVAGRHQRDILFWHTEIGPAEIQWVEDLGGQNFTEVFTRCGVDDFAHQRTPGQCVVDVHEPRPVQRAQVAELFLRVLVIIGPFEVRPGSGRKRHAGAVSDHVPDRGAVLAVAGVRRYVLADPVVEGELTALDEHGHDG